MNKLFVSLAAGAALLQALSACSGSDGPSAGLEAVSSGTDTMPEDDRDPVAARDAGDAGARPDEPSRPDAGPDAAEAGGEVDAGPPAFTQAEMQALVGARCAPCHVGGASAGMSLAGDLRANTVNVPSSQVPALVRIAPGNRAGSYLFHKISGTHTSVGGVGGRMPAAGPFLSAEEIERVGRYIDGL